MSILHRHLLTAVLGAFTLAAGAAGAQPGPGPGPDMAGAAPPPKAKIACAADLRRLCPNEATGKGALKRCIKAHPNEASPRCMAAIQYAKEHRRARKAAAAAAQSEGPDRGQMPPPSGGNVPPR